MYFGITKIYYRKTAGHVFTKIYYRKTVGHVFTKPIQIEGTTEKYFSQ